MSGLNHTLAKGAKGNSFHEFKSHRLRHFFDLSVVTGTRFQSHPTTLKFMFYFRAADALISDLGIRY